MIETMHFRWENDTHQETKMTMGKKQPFEDVSPTTDGDFPLPC